MAPGYLEQLLQSNREGRNERRERKNRKAICEIRLNGQNVGCGCLVYDPLVENPELSKYCIITSSNVVSDENLADYHVLFERVSSPRNPRDILLNDITKKIFFLGSGVVLMFIKSNSPQLHHGCGILLRKCSILKHLPKLSSPSNENEQFCYIGSKRCKCVEEQGGHTLEPEDVGSIPCGSVVLERVGESVNAVGVITSGDDKQVIISPIWLKSSLQELLEEDEKRKNDEEERKKETDGQKVPAEIQARGVWAVSAYNKALQEGSTPVMRVPIMVVGQGRSGKTSLKKSLMGEKFDPKEESTDCLRYFSATNEIWRTGEKSQETDSDSLAFPNRIANVMVNKFGNERSVENQEVLNRQDQSSDTSLEKSSSTHHLKCDPLPLLTENEEPGKDLLRKSWSMWEKSQEEGERDKARSGKISQDDTSGTENTDFPEEVEVESKEQKSYQDAKSASAGNGAHLSTSKQAEKPPEKPKHDKTPMRRKAAEQKVPEETAQCLVKLLQEPDRRNEEKAFSVIWDFGGQLVYYVTHPLFLTPNAIYLLVYDLTQNLDDRAPSVVKPGVYCSNEDYYCKKTNEDYLHFWLSSIFTLSGQQSNNAHSESLQSEKLPEKVPSVFLVCTKADKCKDAKDAEDRARKVYGCLKCQQTPYSQHLFHKHFTVNNTLSGTEDECLGVKQLKNDIHAVAKQLLQMKKEIPVKWLKFEEALKSRKKNDERFISWDEARRIALEECEIGDDNQFCTLLNFLHDQRILIHFEGSSKLKRMVILDPAWLVTLFKSVITVKPYGSKGEDSEEDSEGEDSKGEDEQKCIELWRKLEKGTLDEKLLQTVWAPLLKKATKKKRGKKETEETTESLIAVMEKFSLVCQLPLRSGKSKEYLVPAMLTSVPDTKLATEFLASGSIKSLFLKFRQPHLLPGSQSDEEYVQVPMGFFPRLLLKFTQWCLSKGLPLYEEMFANFARFPINSEEHYSVFFLCRSFSIEIAVHKAEGPGSDNFGKAICHKVKRQLQSILQEMREEFFWLKTMEIAFSVLCTVCCQKRLNEYVAKCCHDRKHIKEMEGCKQEKCLHFLSLTELQNSVKGYECMRHTFGKGDTKVPVDDFVYWMQQDQDINEFGLSSEGGEKGGSISISSEVYSEQPVGTEMSLLKEVPSSDLEDHQSPSRQEPSSKQGLKMASAVGGETCSGSSGNRAAVQKQDGALSIASNVYPGQPVNTEDSFSTEMPPSHFESSQESSAEQTLRGNGTVVEDSENHPSHNNVLTTEILARNQSAVKAYNEVLAEGRICFQRVPVMLVGENRSGKTSLKRSLQGERFNPYEDGTLGTWILKTGEEDQETRFQAAMSFEQQVARLVSRRLKEDDSMDMAPVDPGDISVVDTVSMPANNSERSREPQSTPEIPADAVSIVANLLEQHNEEKGEEGIYPVLWDFGGQAVFHATFPVFLTARAMYVLVYDLSRNPHERARPAVKQGMFDLFEDSFGQKTNLDNLDFWMNSIASLASQDGYLQESSHFELLSYKLPPVFLVCTHADTPYGGGDPLSLAKELWRCLQTKPYKAHIYDVFVVDNTKLGSVSECPEVVRLRKELLAVAKELPQMKETIPIKWLRYEKALQAMKGKGLNYISLQTARQIASEVCNVQDVEFVTLLNFLHNQRILIHFDDTPELNKLIILEPKWLIDVFKKVITIKPYHPKEKAFIKLWSKLETTGILEERLLEHVWAPLISHKEISDSLITMMEKFSLLCPLPLSGASLSKQYLVPSMLKSYPPASVTELVASAQFPSLFITFECGHVPIGLFPRLVLQFFQWEEFQDPINPRLYLSLACFDMSENSVILLCHSSSIEVVVVCQGNPTNESTASLVSFARVVRRKIRLILDIMRKEFIWLKNMAYKFAFMCPVCCQGGAVDFCYSHRVRGCKQEECLHFWPESKCEAGQICTRAAFAEDSGRVQVKQFAPWCEFLDAQLTLEKNDERHFSTIKENTVGLPSEVLEALSSPSFGAKEIVLQLKGRLETDQVSFEDPEPGTKMLIRNLARKAKDSNRLDVIKYLREITPAGTTGPLLPENLDVWSIPFTQRRDLTVTLSGGDEWKLVAERLGLSPAEIRFLDKRTLNPCEAALRFTAEQRYLSVGELYDLLNECELPVVADLL